MHRSVVVGVAAAGAAGAGVAAAVAYSRRGTLARWRGQWAREMSPGALPGALGSRLNSWLNEPLHAQIAEELDLRPDDELLDVACGEGAFLAGHGAHAAYVAGLDLSPAKVDLARRRLAARIAAGTAEVVHGEAGALPWPDGRFSAVTTMDAIGWFPDPGRAIAEMYRVLRPGGRAVLQVGFRAAGEEAETHKAMGGMATVLSEADVRRMAEAAGCTNVSISYRRVAGDWRLYDRLLRALHFEEMRIVRAVKPVTEEASAEPAVPEPVPALAGSS